jgi:hypothetical protein
MIFATRRSRTGERPLFPAFADEAESDLRARDFDVAVLERGQAVASVPPGVVVVSHADEGALQQMDDGCQDRLARQPAQRHMFAHGRPDRGQRAGEGDHVLVLGAFAHFPEPRVISILLAPPRIAP